MPLLDDTTEQYARHERLHAKAVVVADLAAVSTLERTQAKASCSALQWAALERAMDGASGSAKTGAALQQATVGTSTSALDADADADAAVALIVRTRRERIEQLAGPAGAGDAESLLRVLTEALPEVRPSALQRVVDKAGASDLAGFLEAHR
jgi:hypothetical protein